MISLKRLLVLTQALGFSIAASIGVILSSHAAAEVSVNGAVAASDIGEPSRTESFGITVTPDDEVGFIVVLTPTLNGSSIEDFAAEAFRKNELNSKEKENTVLLVLAMKERKIRIEVGYGLRSVLSTPAADAIIRRMKLPLENGKEEWAAAIKDGISEIKRHVSLKGASPYNATAEERKAFLIEMAICLVLSIFIVVGLGYLHVKNVNERLDWDRKIFESSLLARKKVNPTGRLSPLG